MTTAAPTESFDLTDDVAVLLDGKVDPKQQTKVDAAKRRVSMRTTFADLNDAQRKFLDAVVSEATCKGRLVYQTTQLRRCNVCGEACEYRKVARTSKRKRRGDTDYDSPIYLSGIEFADCFVRMTGFPSVGACKKCVAELMPKIEQVLADVPHERKRWPSGPSKWTQYAHKHCKVCGWRGHEGQMERRPTIMGDGTYPAKCPSCGAENHLFQTNVETVDGYTCVPTAPKVE